MAKTGFDPRKMMELAIEVMRESVREPRRDDKTCPMVGTVLWKADGSVNKACRGELRHGDHAEYTLLERKNRDQKLDGAVLFTTLEPCAPGSRREPKVSCAERIVLARIKELWIGIEDLDPTVDRKGIEYLRDSGVIVHMFDRDLQEIIRQENRDSIAQAAERAAQAAKEKRPRKIVLSSFEEAVPQAAIKEFSGEALERFRSSVNIGDAVDSQPFRRRLAQQGFLKWDGDKFTPTGYGVLVFGREPRNAFPQAGLLGTIHYPDGKEETRDFNAPLILVPVLIEEWLRGKLPQTIDRSRMVRQEVPGFPFELVREAVVNALIHRDYEIAGAKCQLIVSPSTITVRSPGKPPPPITLEQMQTFKAPMLSRNPQLHYVFACVGLAEERGFGLKTFSSLPEKLGLPLPSYTFDDPYLVLTLYRSTEDVTRALPPRVADSLSKDEVAGWQFLASQVTVTSDRYAKHMKLDKRTAQRHFNRFLKLGLLRRVGKGPSTRYEVVRR
jgi:ATP-dependent DNA helicase RecG